MTLITGVIIFVPLSFYNRGDMAVISIFGIFILMAIGVMMEKERRKQQKEKGGSKHEY